MASRQALKRLLSRSAVVAATVTTVGGFVQAALPEVVKALSPKADDSGEYIVLLDQRARTVIATFDRNKDYEGEAEFLELHRRNVDAIRSRHSILAHEITRHIQQLVVRRLGGGSYADGVVVYSLFAFVETPSTIDDLWPDRWTPSWWPVSS